MTIPEKAVKWALKIADDNSHGYDQSSRWGPDYDCSSLVISAYKQAGVPLTCTYTGNMRSDMLNYGFAPVPTANLKTGAGLKPGDVLLNEVHHTAMYIGDGKIVHAAGNEFGGATGGKTGDQTGKEICITNYFNFPWDVVLRYCRKDDSVPVASDDKYLYTVKAGDSLWAIAEKTLGAGEYYFQIKQANNMQSDMIYPGQKLIIPHGEDGQITISVTITDATYSVLKIMADGWNKTIGQTIDELVKDAT